MVKHGEISLGFIESSIEGPILFGKWSWCNCWSVKVAHLWKPSLFPERPQTFRLGFLTNNDLCHFQVLFLIFWSPFCLVEVSHQQQKETNRFFKLVIWRQRFPSELLWLKFECPTSRFLLRETKRLSSSTNNFKSSLAAEGNSETLRFYSSINLIRNIHCFQSSYFQ